MAKITRKLGFVYFKSPEYMLNKQVKTWLTALKQLGASYVMFRGGFERSIPEDVFISAQENGLSPIVHIDSELPIARKFNDVSVLLDAYAKWGVNHIILGDKPNTKNGWNEAGWHYENLADHFLDRFIPLANHAVRIGINPILAPLQPGGDFWDTAFIELILKGLKQRKLDSIIEKLILSSYGYTFQKPISWGMGGPERWAASKPYLTPEGQEDQLGFHNFEWIQAHAKREIGKRLPMMILNAGNPGVVQEQVDPDETIEDIQRISQVLQNGNKAESVDFSKNPLNDESVLGCFFDLNAINQSLEEALNFDILKTLFKGYPKKFSSSKAMADREKKIDHYLLLPSHLSGVSDAVLNKVRPIIKKYQPTMGFSLDEALMAQKVTVFPDPHIITDEQINHLRAAGCLVEVLPDMGIDIATILQD